MKTLHSVHIYITPMHTQPGIKERFLSDLRECVDALKVQPKDKKLEGRVSLA